MSEVHTRIATIDPVPAEQYRATFAPQLAEISAGQPLPPGWEGLYFPFAVGMAGLRPDGTPADDVLPKIDLPRRMYAGEDTAFHRPITVGDVVEQQVRAGSIVEKNSRRGRLVFADIERRYLVNGEVAIESIWHDVFLEQDAGTAPSRAPEHTPARSIQHTLDSRHLFRFSAITFNTHRVHYDRQWARQREGLPDLLVHGPLTRLLLIDAAVTGDRSGRLPQSYAFTATAPLFVDRQLAVGVTDTDEQTLIEATDDLGSVAATGRIRW